jgi:hypothetical protein
MMSRPYQEYETAPAWKVIDEGISALVANQDLMETTQRNYIVGYLVKQLVETGVIMAPEQRG